MSHRHFLSLALRVWDVICTCLLPPSEAFEQGEAEFIPIFSAVTERFDLVPAEFLVIPTDGQIVGGIGDLLGRPP